MRGVASDKRYVIDVTKPWHVAWWAAELGVSEDSLLDAVDMVSNQVHAVEYYLGLRREYYLGLRKARQQHETVGPENASLAPTLQT